MSWAQCFRRSSVVLALAPAQQRALTRSKISIYTLATRKTRALYTAETVFEAPNWSPDGSYLLLNSQGKLWKLKVAGGEPEAVDSGEVSRINNDHGISPDGKLFAISAQQIFVLPSAGGAPRQITQKTPSYFHGWSPDGQTLAYCAQRDGNFDIYGMQATGGEEVRLTSHPGYDDGPDYSRDGRWIYFNSDRSGSWDIWRIPPTGGGPADSKAERVTSDDLEDWFPHPSPDGKWIVFLSFPKGTKGHPPNQQVKLRIMPSPGKKPAPSKIDTLMELFGGQGTMNVNSWSPDSKEFAFVSYELK